MIHTPCDDLSAVMKTEFQWIFIFFEDDFSNARDKDPAQLQMALSATQFLGQCALLPRHEFERVVGFIRDLKVCPSL